MYGITELEYTELYKFQNGLCGICQTELIFRYRQTHIDHDHNTGAIRGLLCNSCNTGLGLFKDSPEICQYAIDYINKAGKSKKKGKKK